MRQLEDAALARHDLQRFLLAGVGDVFAEDHDARVARHLVLERPIEHRDHRVRLAFRLRRCIEGRRTGIDVGRVEPEPRAALRRLGRRLRRHRGVVDLALDVGRHRLQVVVGRQTVRTQEFREAADGIAPRFCFTLGRRFVQLLVVGQRMRVRPNHTRVDERRTFARAHIRGGIAHRAEAAEEIGAVERFDMQSRK